LPAAGKWVKLEIDAARVGLTPGTEVHGLAFTQHGGTAWWDRAGLITSAPQGPVAFDTLTAWLQLQHATGAAGQPKDVQDILRLDRAKRGAAQQKRLRDHFVATAWSKSSPEMAPLNRELAALAKEKERLEKQVPTTLVFKERAQPRPAYLLKRGEYDRRGEQVGRGTPGFLPPLPPGPPNRLTFARWLTDPGHPLTARVAVNRFWQQCFG